MAHPLDQITQVFVGDKKSHTYYPIAIIGCGESGICMGARLQQVLGFDQFRIFERKSQLGGTWYTNTYPGIACDVPAILYSYSFAQNPKWTAPYPSGPEIVRYLYDVCNRFKILDKIQCDTNVKSAKWIESDEEWEVILEYLAPGVGDMSTAERRAFETEHGTDAAVYRLETIRTKILASAVGGLVEPKPHLDVPGLDTFEGKVVHSARWDSSIDFKGKDVTVVGTGCSSAQVMASLAEPKWGVKSLTQLLRSPPWVVPAIPSSESWNKWAPFFLTYIPGLQNTLRLVGFSALEYDFISHFPGTERAKKSRKATAKVLLEYLQKKVPPQYLEIMTPNYELFCKRRVIDDGWFKALRDARAEITSQPLTAVGPKTITVGPGRHYPPMDTDANARTDKREIPCDVLIMANGFSTNEWLHPLDVTGKDGKSLNDVWKERGGAQAYMGTAMDGFPNFFMIFGPNTVTGHSSVILATENMVNYSLKFIQPVLKGDIRTWEVKESAERKWTADMQKELKQTVFNAGAKNWYIDDNGWNSTAYPRTQIDFTLRCLFPRWDHWSAVYTRKGLAKLWLTRLVKTAILVVTLVEVRHIYKYGRSTMNVKARELMVLARETLAEGLKRLGVVS